eukprot:scaffold90896_cov37-Cyclotella_meneghiniana.AAC.1
MDTVKKLRKLYDENESHPYPSTEDMAQMALTIKLTEYQINTWLKFQIEAVGKLRKWYDEHESNPCPRTGEFVQLALTTIKLTKKQK